MYFNFPIILLTKLNLLQFLISYGLPFFKQLQSEKIDLVEAVNLAEATISALKNIRINVGQEFNHIFYITEVIN